MHCEARPLVRLHSFAQLHPDPDVDGATAAAGVADLGRLSVSDTHHAVQLRDRTEGASMGREATACDSQQASVKMLEVRVRNDAKGWNFTQRAKLYLDMFYLNMNHQFTTV